MQAGFLPRVRFMAEVPPPTKRAAQAKNPPDHGILEQKSTKRAKKFRPPMIRQPDLRLLVQCSGAFHASLLPSSPSVRGWVLFPHLHRRKQAVPTRRVGMLAALDSFLPTSGLRLNNGSFPERSCSLSNRLVNLA